MPPVNKLYPFRQAKDANSKELEEVYKFLQKQIIDLQTSLSALSTSISATPDPVDYSYQIQLLTTQLASLTLRVAALENPPASSSLSLTLSDSDSVMLVDTPSGVKKLNLLDYP